MPVSGNHRKQLCAWIPPFLKALNEGLCVREAARIAGTCSSTVYHHRAADEAFRACWDRAMERGTELLELEAVRRAYHGTEKPVYYKGEQCGSYQEYSDTLMMFILRGRRPEMYRDSPPAATVNVAIQQNIAAVDTMNKLLEQGTISPAPFIDGDALRAEKRAEEVKSDPSRSDGEAAPPDITGPPSNGRHGGPMDPGPSLNGHQ